MVKLLSLKELKNKGIPFSRQHLHELIKEGEFPRPIKIGKKTNAWPEAEIEAYLQSRITQRDA